MSYIRTSRRGMGATAAQDVATVGNAVTPLANQAAGSVATALLNSGCGNTCIVTSKWANQAEALLKQNIKAYFDIATPRPVSAQQAAMANFMSIWNSLQTACSATSLGTAGENCIGDRQDGACKWKANSQPYPTSPAVGECWNWWSGYYWPIANDPDVAADAQSSAAQALANTSETVAAVTSDTTTKTSSSMLPLLLIAAGVGLLVVWNG